MDGHRLLRTEFLTAGAMDALAIIHHGPFVHHGNGLRVLQLAETIANEVAR